MASILNSTAASANGDFAPTADFVTIQVESAAAAFTRTATFAIMGKNDAAAAYQEIGRLDANTPIGKFAAMPLMRVAMTNNLAGQAAKAWSDEA